MQNQFQMFKNLLILLIGLHVTFAKSLKKTDFGVEVSKKIFYLFYGNCLIISLHDTIHIDF